MDRTGEIRLRRVRVVGALELLPAALNARASAHIVAGEFAAARSIVHEMENVTQATGLPHACTPAAVGSVTPAYTSGLTQNRFRLAWKHLNAISSSSYPIEAIG